jgi:hypothetical protein
MSVTPAKNIAVSNRYAWRALIAGVGRRLAGEVNGD